MKNFFLVIPTRDRFEYLSNLMIDLNAFSKYISTVIVVDQSSNPIKEKIADLTLEYKWKIIENTRDKSVNHSRNLALKEYSDEEWLFFLDDDLRIPAIAFQKIIEHLNTSCIDVLIPGIQFNGMDEDCIYHTVLDTISKPNNFSKSRFRLQVSSGLNIVKSKVFIDAGFLFDENFTIWGDDWDYGMRLLQAGANIYYQPEILVEHLEAPNGGQRDKGKFLTLELEKQKLYFYFYRKHFSATVVKQQYFLAIMVGLKYIFKYANFSNLWYSIKGYKLAKSIKIN